MDVSLRPATAADAELTYAWASDPETRAASFQPAAFPRQEHERWLQASLAGEQRVLSIAERAGQPVGLLRLDRVSPRCAELGITVAPERRGQGLAQLVLRAGIQHARELGLSTLVARIRPDNARSIRSFLRAGFSATAEEEVHGQRARRYELRLTVDSRAAEP